MFFGTKKISRFNRLLGICFLVAGLFVGVSLILSHKSFDIRRKAAEDNSLYVTIQGGNNLKAGYLGLFQSRGVPSTLIDTSVYAPEFYTNYYSYNSKIYLVSTQDTTSDLTLKFTNIDNYSNVFTKKDSLGAHQTLEITGTKYSLPYGRYSVEINSTQPVMGNIFSWVGQNQMDSRNNMANHLIPKKLAGTIVGNMKAYYDASGTGFWESGHSVMNVSDSDIEAEIDIFNYGGELVLSKTVTIPAKASYAMYMKDYLNKYVTDQDKDKIIHSGVKGRMEGSLVAKVVGTQANALVSYFQIVNTDPAVTSDVISYTGMTNVEATPCNYHFPLYLYSYGAKYISGFTVQSLGGNLGPIKYAWINGNVYAEKTLRDSMPKYLSQQRSFYGFDTIADFKDFLPFKGTSFVEKVCADKPIVTLSNSTRDGLDVGFGDAGFSEIWKGSEIYFPVFSWQNLLHAFVVFNPGSKDINYTVTIYNKNGEVYKTFDYVVNSKSMKSVLYKDIVPQEFTGSAILQISS